jgi:hypothetical protein
MQYLRIIAPFLPLLLLASCAPRSARRELRIAVDAQGDVSAEPADSALQDSVVPSFPDASLPDGSAIFDQRPNSPDLTADRASDAAVPDTAPPDGVPLDMAPPDRPPRNALLLVITPSALRTDDQRIRALLQTKNMIVTLGDDVGPATQATGMDLIVISGSVSSVAVGTKYTNSTLPILTLEAFGFANMGMSGPTQDTDYGSTDLTDVVIAIPGHPLAAGFPAGNLTVVTAATRLGWGVVGPMATRVATMVGMPNRAAIFSYEPGQMMVGLVAPARRVGFFPISPTPNLLNAAGLRLLDAAVDWIIRP